MENGQLHCWDGRPAVDWGDAGGYYFWRGVLMRDVVGANSEGLRPRRFLTWRNAEVRRVAIERYGLGRLIDDGVARRVQEDRFGKLWRMTSGGSDFHFVEVLDATPAPDGTRKTYYL